MVATLLQRIKNLTADIDETTARERQTKELKRLIGCFLLVNEEMPGIILACQFVLEISGDAKLLSLFEKTRKKYETLRESLISLWSENPQKIDISQLTISYKSLNELMNASRELETEALETFHQKIEDVTAECSLANSFSIIPDIELDLKVFEDAKNFLSNAGRSVWEISEFCASAHLESTKKGLKKRVKTWNSILRKLEIEKRKFNLQNMGKKLSSQTISFLKDFVESRGVVSFESLSGGIVEELKSKFPELSRELRVTYRDMDSFV